MADTTNYGPLLSCPWCGVDLRFQFVSAQIQHLIDCGDAYRAANPRRRVQEGDMTADLDRMDKAELIAALREARAGWAECEQRCEFIEHKPPHEIGKHGEHYCWAISELTERRAHSKSEVAILIGEQRERAERAEAEAARMREIFRWLLGEEGDFPERQPGQGAYYWRSHLRKKLDALAELEPTK